jgi:ABC-type antimicrobial peptide transport system permease subunit
MNELFGLDMTYFAAGCVAVSALIFAFIGWIALRNPVMFKMGLRNIPRRKAQTVLIIVGLMLSTLIITAAFGTGDTMTNSITREVYQILGPADQLIEWDTENHPAPAKEQTIPLELVEQWKEQLAGEDIAALVPFIVERLPVLNLRTRLNEASPSLTAFRPEDATVFGGLRDVDGQPVQVGINEIAINKALAEEIDARVGDQVAVFYEGEPVVLTVVAIVPNSFLGGSLSTADREGAAVNWDFLGPLTGKEGVADFVAVSNDGTVREGVKRTAEVRAIVTPILEGTPYRIDRAKEESLENAEFFGNLFTSIFVIFGLFSIGAGVLLIFLIFIMLAAERKPEMGMARAVGAKRRQIVESFLSEGMGYDVGAALLGLVAGIGVAAAMVFFVKSRLGEGLGLALEFDISARSLVVSFCLGLVVTFIVVFMASWRASRINIVAAIRDLPESKPYNPEAATAFGYLRAALNGFATFGFLAISFIGLFRFPDVAPVFFLGVVLGLAGPFLPMLRNHNFGAPGKIRKKGERLPLWPFFIPLFTISYTIAVLIVRFTRDRKPSSVSVWWLVAGCIVMPVGLVMAALQDRGKPVSWGVGFATVGLVIGFLLFQWGVDDNRMAWFALGLTFMVLWVVLTLSYFHVGDRAAFTIGSLALIGIWYLIPGGRLEWLVGELDGDAEMFFITGVVLVTAGTFVVIYNADIILPVIARLGTRFGRIYPAVKTAIAYPLTSRFRTGLTIGMIGLIMFVLSMQAALNTNFTKAFTSEDSKGGFDVRVTVNSNNRTDDLLASLREANASPDAPRQLDLTRIEAVGELRNAWPFEVDIEDPEWAKKDPATRDPLDQWKHTIVHGAKDDFLRNQRLPLLHRAAGYETDEEVWAAVAADPSFVVIPAIMTQQPDGFGPPGWEDLLYLPASYTGSAFTPFTLNLRNRATGTVTTVTVIGQTKDGAGTFWPGMIAQERVVTSTFPGADSQEFFLRLAPGTDSREYAQGVESLLVQASADSLDKIIEDNEAINRTFLEMFQGFLALGLFVGIAALGVISLRSVVERRQQIGMLRAIGYQRRMVQLSFLLESGFIAITGILLGLLLGLTFAAVLFTSGEFGATTSDISFTVPWAQVGVVTAIALGAAVLTTYLPARAASHVAVAEALRYE